MGAGAGAGAGSLPKCCQMKKSAPFSPAPIPTSLCLGRSALPRDFGPSTLGPGRQSLSDCNVTGSPFQGFFFSFKDCFAFLLNFGFHSSCGDLVSPPHRPFLLVPLHQDLGWEGSKQHLTFLLVQFAVSPLPSLSGWVCMAETAGETGWVTMHAMGVSAWQPRG